MIDALPQTGTRLRATVTANSRGTPGQRNWSSPVETDFPCYLTSAGTTEQGGTVLTRTFSLIVNPDTDVRPTDRWRVDGTTYEVDGAPLARYDDMGVLHHYTVPLRLVTGA